MAFPLAQWSHFTLLLVAPRPSLAKRGVGCPSLRHWQMLGRGLPVPVTRQKVGV